MREVSVSRDGFHLDCWCDVEIGDERSVAKSRGSAGQREEFFEGEGRFKTLAAASLPKK